MDFKIVKLTTMIKVPQCWDVTTLNLGIVEKDGWRLEMETFPHERKFRWSQHNSHGVWYESHPPEFYIAEGDFNFEFCRMPTPRPAFVLIKDKEPLCIRETPELCMDAAEELSKIA